jgi:hypothetical protein
LIWGRFPANLARFQSSSFPRVRALVSLARNCLIGANDQYGDNTMTATVGQPAPEFTLVSSKMEDISLESQRGKTVMLLFVPLAFTPT